MKKSELTKLIKEAYNEVLLESTDAEDVLTAQKKLLDAIFTLFDHHSGKLIPSSVEAGINNKIKSAVADAIALTKK